MKLTAFVLVALLSPTPASHPPSCFFQERHNGGDDVKHVEWYYACELGPDGDRVAVDKSWFKAHCQTFDNLSSGASAQCDAYAPGDVVPFDRWAVPSKTKARLKLIGFTAIGVGLVLFCALAGGGCGAGGE